MTHPERNAGASLNGRDGRHQGDEIVGQSPLILAAKSLARHVAPMNIPVLIVGETGTGKELLASYIHEHSGRDGHFIDVDCGAIPEELVESLLFGHQRGAFTGAVADTTGLLVQADGGSLFLDELASLPLSGQAKLLRVLETGRVRSIGASATRTTSFRVIATAQQSLGDKVREGAFRNDLLQRVAGLVIEVPSLAARQDDIPILATHFAACAELRLTHDATAFLIEQPWPGNVRQLKSAIARGALFQTDGQIDLSAVRQAVATGPRLVVDEAASQPGSRMSLAALCRHHEGDVDRIAEAMGVSRATAYRRLASEGLSLRAFRAEPAG